MLHLKCGTTNKKGTTMSVHTQELEEQQRKLAEGLSNTVTNIYYDNRCRDLGGSYLEKTMSLEEIKHHYDVFFYHVGMVMRAGGESLKPEYENVKTLIHELEDIVMGMGDTIETEDVTLIANKFMMTTLNRICK